MNSHTSNPGESDSCSFRGRNLYLNPKSFYRRQETSTSPVFSSTLLCDYG